MDHGKTCLIKALTGVDTDRLKEEKERGITIELGFAYLDFGEGQGAGIVDVPGHEKFVKHMLAGAGGMDIAMLVVAANEGVMPQTIEHLEILSVLGVKKGLIALTKTDLADPDMLTLAKEEIRGLVRGTFLEGAPIIPVSAVSGEGMGALKEKLKKLWLSLEEKPEDRSFRLPVDRVFLRKGFGTVVTGTMLDGHLITGQEVMLYPQKLPLRARSIQVHGRDVDCAFAGQRTAVNLPDCSKDQIRRGDVLGTKNALFPTRMLDVRLELLRHTERVLKHGSRVHVHHGAKALLGKVFLMEADELHPAERGYAQIRLEEEIAARRSDRFVLRFYSPVETIGGGIILDVCPAKHRRKDTKTLELFEIKDHGSLSQRLELALWERRGYFDTLDALAGRCDFPKEEARACAEDLCRAKKLTKISEERYIHPRELEIYRKKAEVILEEYHSRFPLKEGMPLGEFRSRLELPEPRFADSVIKLLQKEGAIREEKGCICKGDFQVRFPKKQEAIRQKLLQDYLEMGLAPMTTELYKKEQKDLRAFLEVFHALLKNGTLIRLDDSYCVHKIGYEKAKCAFEELAASGQAVATGAYRDALGCSRKVAIALLEHFDTCGFTEKTEAGRILKSPAVICQEENE